MHLEDCPGFYRCKQGRAVEIGLTAAGNLPDMPGGNADGYMLGIPGSPGGGRGCSKSRGVLFWKRGPFCAIVTCSLRSPTYTATCCHEWCSTHFPGRLF